MARIPVRLNSPSKYHAKRTDGYASQAEARRAADLELELRVGAIRDLRKQPKFLLIPKDDLGRDVSYIADFSYIRADTNTLVVEDVKGFKTPVYKLKRRMLFDRYGIKITETC